MRRAVALVGGLVLLFAFGAPARATHNTDSHSSNVKLVSTFTHGDTYRTGTDLAFWGDIAVLGSYENPGGFRLVDISDRASPSLVGQFPCPGAQGDVSIWRSLVFVSVDSPRENSTCAAGPASAAQQQTGTAWEGIRIVSIADPANPTQIGAVRTDCGSHTHTLVPDPKRDRVLIYVLSYPLGAPTQSCNVASHRKISVVEVPLSDPAAARVVSTPDVSPAIGCHDVTVFTRTKRAAAACITESQMWDISDPLRPKVLSHIVNPSVNIHHSSAFSWDGRTIVLGDELGGALASPGCFDNGHAPLGALWFYDVSNPAAPQLKGWFKTPQTEASVFCTAHNFNVVPLRSGKDILISGWYNGGTSAIDFTDPSKPTQIGYYVPRTPARAAAWSSYWYDGLIYSNNFDEDVHQTTRRSRGMDIFALTHTSVRNWAPQRRMNPQTQERPPRAR